MGLENVDFSKLETINRDLSFNTRPDRQILDKLISEAAYDGRIADFVPIYQFHPEDLRLRGEIFNTVLESHKNLHPKDREVVAGQLERAFYLAECAHQNQKRESGEYYIRHCYSVAQILAELGMPYPVVIAGLLHDTLEDTTLTAEDIEKAFYSNGSEIRLLVEGCRNSEWDVKEDEVIRTIPEFEKLGEERRQAAIKEAFDTLTLTKLLRQFLPNKLFQGDRDPRIPFIKLADRLHNIRTIWGVTDERKRRKKAKETLEYYVPLARVLGWHSLTTELEDLCFEVLEPEKYNMVRGLFFKFMEKPPEYDSADPYRHIKLVEAMAVSFREVENGLKGLYQSDSVSYVSPGIYQFYKSWLLENDGRNFLRPNDYLPELKIIISAGFTSDKLLPLTADLTLWMALMGYFPDEYLNAKFEVFEGELYLTFKGRKHPKKIRVTLTKREKVEIEGTKVFDLFVLGRDRNARAKEKLREISDDINTLLVSHERGERLEVLAKVLGGLKYLRDDGEEIWIPRETNYATYAFGMLGNRISRLIRILVDGQLIPPDFVNRPISHSQIQLDYSKEETPFNIISPIWLASSDDPYFLREIGAHLERKMDFFRGKREISEWEREIRDIGEEKIASRLHNRPSVIKLSFIAQFLRELGYGGEDNYASFYKDVAFGKITGEILDEIAQKFPLKGTEEWRRYTEFTERKKESSVKKHKKHRRK